jgi:hypothetical protein
MWHPISTAPFDVDLELAVVDKDEHHALVFPCRRIPEGWVNAALKKWIDVRLFFPAIMCGSFHQGMR